MALAVGIFNGAALERLQSRDSLQKLLLAAARDAGHAQNLAGIGLKGGMGEHLAALVIDDRYIAHLQLEAGIHGLGAFDVQVHAPAHHHFGQAFLRGLGGLNGTDAVPLAKHGHAVAQAQNLVELVGDDDDGMPLIAHVAQHLEQPVRLLGGEHGGRLVQNQDVRAAVEHFDDFHRLLLRHAHFIDLFMRINLKSVLFGQGANLALHLPHVQPQLSRKAQNDVFGCGEHIHQLKMLVNHADTQGEGVLGRADDHLAALHIDMARVRKVNAGQHVHQRRLAAAVLAQHT